MGSVLTIIVWFCVQEKQQKRAGGASEPKDQAPAGGRIKKTQPASPQPVVPKAKQQPKAQNAPIAKTTPSSKKTQSTPVAAVKAALAPQSETKVGEVGPDPALDDVDIEVRSTRGQKEAHPT